MAHLGIGQTIQEVLLGPQVFQQELLLHTHHLPLLEVVYGIQVPNILLLLLLLTEHPKIINANEDFILWSDFQSIVDSLKKAIIHSDIDLVLALMKKIGIDYFDNNLIVDFLYNERKA